MLLGVTEYHRPASAQEALGLLQRDPEGTAVLAGGTELTASHRRELRALIDLQNLGLSAITEREGSVAIGAMTTLKALAASPLIRPIAGGLLARAAHMSAPATIRAAATLGGTLAGRKGGDELPTVLLALGARVSLATPEPVSIPLADFLDRRDELLEGFIVTHVTVPVNAGARGGLAHVSRSPADRAIVVVAAVVTGERSQIALGGLAPQPRLLPANIAPDDVPRASADWPPAGDFRASAEYRSWVAPVLARRALEEALGGNPA